MKYCMMAGSVALLTTLGAIRGEADVLLLESFEYADGDSLDASNGGAGFASAWSGDKALKIRERSYSYTDSSGNELTTAGLSVLGVGSDKKVVRDIAPSTFAGKTDIWASFGLDAATNGRVSVSVDEKVFFGQGNLSAGATNWGVSDDSSQIADSGLEASGSAFLVSRLSVDGDGKIQSVWAWLNPTLDSTPLLSDSFTGAGGVNVSGLGATFSKITVALKDGDGSTESFISEIRFGDTFADVTGFAPGTAVPEPAHWLLIGAGLLFVIRRRHRATTQS